MNLSFRLPYPPAVNNLFANVPKRGRVKTAYYQAWIDEAAYRLRLQVKRARIPGPFKCEIVATKPDQRKRDIDGLCKAALDLMTSEGVIDDDSQCQDLRIRWGGTEPGILVTLEAA